MAVAVITGASEGLGRALALDLARTGWSLVIDARRAEPLARVADAARRAGSPLVVDLPGDVADAGHRGALSVAAAEAGGTDLLVANAATLGPSPLPKLADLALADLDATLAVNVTAQVGLIQSLLPSLLARRGAVVAVTSDAAVEGYAGWGAYGATKAAFEQVAVVLAAEHPELRVYRFDPGDMRTRMHQDAFPGEDISDRPLPEAAVGPLRALVEGAHQSGRYRAADLEVAGATR